MKNADRRAFTWAYAAWLLGIFAFFIPAATWNPVSRFNLTRALVERGSLTVDEYISSTGDRSQVGEHWYSDKAPVVAFLAVPAYAAVYATSALRGRSPDFRAYRTATTPAVRVEPNRTYQQAFYACSLSTAGAGGIVIALLLFSFLRRRSTPQAAFLGSSLAVLATPIFPYATSLYGHVPAAAFMLGGVMCLDPRSARGMPSRFRVRVAGACFVLAAGSEYLTAVPVAVVAVWFLFRVAEGARVRTIVDFVLGGFVPAALLAFYLTAVFGAPWRTGYSFEDRPEFIAGHASGLMGLHAPSLEGLYGLTFGARRGLFYVAPLTLLALVRTARAALRRRDFSVEAGLSVLIALLLMNAGYYMWWGGAAVGPRHLIPGITILGVGIASSFRSRYPWLQLAAAILAAISLAIALAAALVGLEAPEFGNVIEGFIWPRVRDASFATFGGASNLGLKLGLSPATSILPLLAWVLIGYGYLLVQTRPRVGRSA